MSAAFDIGFAVFVLCMIAVAVLAVRSARRRDRAERERRAGAVEGQDR